MLAIKLAFTDLADLPGWKSPGQRVRKRTVDISEQSPDFKILQLLKQKFTINIDESDPDYLIFSVFGNNFLKYPNAVRIFFTGENIRPDFNLCDYAFGFEWLDFGDRYYRCPHYKLYSQFNDICDRRHSKIARADIAKQKTRFCNFVYTNRTAHPIRDTFFHLLSQYKKVDSVGSHLNNTGQSLGAAYLGDWASEKVTFQTQYKFTIAFENSSSPGYTTEKIVHALAADSIPIYWGNPQIGREFNTNRFINCHDYDSLERIVARVAEIDQNDSLFERMVNEPFFPDGGPPDSLRDEQILAQFEHIFSQDKESAFRRNRFAWGKRYEDQRVREAQASSYLEGNGIIPKLYRLRRKVLRRFKTQMIFS